MCQRHNRFVSVLKHKPLFLWIVANFFTLVGLFIGLEVYRMPLILWTLQNISYGISRPVTGIVRRRVPLDYLGGFSVHNPPLLVFRVFHVTIRLVRTEVFSGISL